MDYGLSFMQIFEREGRLRRRKNIEPKQKHKVFNNVVVKLPIVLQNYSVCRKTECCRWRWGGHQVGISPTAEPNTQLCVPNTQLPVPNTQISKPSTQHVVPNTQNFEAKHPKSRSIFSKISEQSPNILGHAPSSLEPSGSTAEPLLCAQRGQMRGSRSVGPKPPL